ncbi:tyrosine-type recombinase/integrase [Poseidonibacter ostreae]|uniref:Tyrosine-type recombinase/integrase n=1 Tax=Poseidonibacter ostreae TaxID=2654171 RepID=A0ABQ6VLU9_9BACT|nr:site-specific integrase [Poseidonibacter ostreae]KAB7891547.1 tyrosine-type recombinase/integrase [Poseidonibacter ostreae]
MPKKIIPLTDTKIKGTKPKDKDYVLVDGNGLRLLVKKNGSKIWEFIYSSPILKEERKTLIKDENNQDVLDQDGRKTYKISIAPKRRKKTLSKYVSGSEKKKIEKMTDLEISNITIATLSEARSIVKRYNEILGNGFDVIQYLEELKQKETAEADGMFKSVMDKWFEGQKDKIQDITYKKKYQVFVSSVLPYFENKHIKDITKLELFHVLEEKEKTAAETASRLFNYLIDLWSYAVTHEYCKYNYLANIKKKHVLTKKRTPMNYEKITDEKTFKELINSIYSYKGMPSIRNALRLVIHIPLRASNLCNLKWEHIDFENKTLTIPRELMKVKNLNLPDFRLPLTDEVINILQEQKELMTKYTELKEYVFIGANNIKPIAEESPNAALIRLGYTATKKHTLHSFRGSYRTILEEKQQEHDISDKILESVLDHYKNLTKVELAYLNTVSYLEQQKPLMKFWSDYIMSLLEK